MSTKTVAVFLMLMVVVSVVNAQSCPGIASYISCRDNVSKGSKLPAANSQCCAFIKDVNKVSDYCLCETAKKDKISYLGITVYIDFATVAKLPGVCGRRKNGFTCNGVKF